MTYLSLVDILVPAVLLLLFYFIGKKAQHRHIESEPYYKYFVPALFVKVLGGAAVCLVYAFYYSGGDTTGYYHDNTCVVNLFMQQPMAALRYTFAEITTQNWFDFNYQTDWPYYIFDSHAVWVTKFTWVLSLITFNSFIGQTMLLSFLTFFSMWRLYKIFVMEFPAIQKGLAFAILFIPSVDFWGSGLLKDTITLSAAAIFTTSVYYIIKLKRSYMVNTLYLLFAAWVLIKIKPYICFALMPGTLIWLASYQLEKIKNKVLKSFFTPILIVVAIFFGVILLKNMGTSLGSYSLDTVLERAAISQQELKKDIYQGSSFDIGEFDPTVSGVLSKAPIAIGTALFRPFIWETYNPAMFVSGIENLGILIFTIYLLIQLRIINFFRLLTKNHLLFFSFSFSIFFAFSVGLSSSNFGALVRYKIPAIPFFVSTLLITSYYYQSKKREEEREYYKLT